MKHILVDIFCFSVAIISIAGSLFAYSVFRKRGKIFGMVLLGYICCSVFEWMVLANTMFSIPIINLSITNIAYVVVWGLTQMLYLIRIYSLGIEKTTKNRIISLIIWILPILSVLISVLQYNALLSNFAAYVLLISVEFISFGVESMLFDQLMNVIHLMLVYRPKLVQRLTKKSVFYFYLLIVTQVIYLIGKTISYSCPFDAEHIKIVSFGLRLFIVTDFYKDITKSYRTDEEIQSIVYPNL
eukprot:NODE_751_length_4217_cov_0.448762.p3 type:complete len:242 gc:universal NODE_751_length_4217_cov_0.448762:2988-3713(+)